METPTTTYARAWGTAAVVVLIDQLTKLWARQSMTTMLNTGVSFSLGQQLPTFFTKACIALFVAVLLTISPRFSIFVRKPYAAGLFLGGAFSNVLDRLMHGGVVDWLRVPYLNITNNLADCALAASVVLIGLDALRTSKWGRSI